LKQEFEKTQGTAVPSASSSSSSSSSSSVSSEDLTATLNKLKLEELKMGMADLSKEKEEKDKKMQALLEGRSMPYFSGFFSCLILFLLCRIQQEEEGGKRKETARK
jgi:hypothetical protein